jgi:glycosyltransferase involved in cell wall biosynthesis
MRICMVVNNMNEFGGLEEFAKNLAIGIQQQGHQVSVFSTVWVLPNNQYLRSLRENNVTVVQLPKWLSLATSDWPTKEKILAVAMWLSSPLVYLLGSMLFLLRRRPWGQSLSSARNWLRGQWMSRVIGPDRRKPFACLVLNWWRFRWHPDLFHIQGYTSDLLFVIEWAHTKRMPVIYEEHQTPDAQFDWWQDFKESINKASTVVAVSEKSAQALREVCGVTQPIVVAYYMVPDPVESGWVADDKPGKSDEPIRVTTNARLYVTKGLTYLLEAIAQVKAVHPATQFRVYGDGPLREELLAYAEQLGLDGSRIFVGAFTSREELSHIMAQTDIFVMSSILEGLPIALLEAMSYGRPVVVTPVGGIPEAIKDGVNGLLCEPRDPECLAQKICSLIEDPILRLRLGLAARKSYEQGPFNPTSVCRQYVSIYQKVLSGNHLV